MNFRVVVEVERLYDGAKKKVEQAVGEEFEAFFVGKGGMALLYVDCAVGKPDIIEALWGGCPAKPGLYDGVYPDPFLALQQLLANKAGHHRFWADV